MAGRQMKKRPAGKRPANVKKKKNNKNYRIGTLLLFIVLSIYLSGYLVKLINRPSISIETLNYGTIDVPATLRGIIVRDEVVINSSIDGQAEYYYSENDRVAKNTVICSVKNTGTTDVIESEIKKIDKSILEAQKSREDFSLFKDDIKSVEESIENIIDNSIYKFVNNDLSEIYSFKNQIQTQINQRNQIWLAENSKSTDELAAQRQQFKNQLSGNSETVTAPESGIISLKVDNFEEIVTPDVRTSIAEDQIKITVRPSYISKSLSQSAGSPLFKLIKSNTWYVVSYVPNSVASEWETGDYMELTTTVDDEEKTVQMQIESMEAGENSTYVVFVSDRNMADFLDIRTMDFKVNEKLQKGLKVPNEAIVERAFLKIPVEYISESNGVKGVIKRESDGDKFKELKILKSDDKYAYILQNFNDFKLGDILIGTGEEAQQYSLSEVTTFNCVYVANSSISEITVVDILGQNSDYAIIDAETGYGPKVYDKIVSDASVISNEEQVS